MLCISLLPNDYFTIGENTVVQFSKLSGERVHLTVNAPREVPILRGEVWERQGKPRPACVMEANPRYVRQLLWNHEKKEALAELREALERLSDTPEKRVIQNKLNVIFPQASQEND